MLPLHLGEGWGGGATMSGRSPHGRPECRFGFLAVGHLNNDRSQARAGIRRAIVIAVSVTMANIASNIGHPRSGRFIPVAGFGCVSPHAGHAVELKTPPHIGHVIVAHTAIVAAVACGREGDETAEKSDVVVRLSMDVRHGRVSSFAPRKNVLSRSERRHSCPANASLTISDRRTSRSGSA